MSEDSPKTPPEAGRRSKYTTIAWYFPTLDDSATFPSLSCSFMPHPLFTWMHIPRLTSLRGAAGIAVSVRSSVRANNHVQTAWLGRRHVRNLPSNASHTGSTNGGGQPKPTVPSCQSNKRDPAQLDSDGLVQNEQSSDQRKRCKSFTTEPELSSTLSQSQTSPAPIDLTLHTAGDPENILTATGEDETHTFNLQLQAGTSISLSSQLWNLCEKLGAQPPSPLTPADKARPTATIRPVVSIQLPNLELLQDLTEVFFRDMNTFLPLLNQNEAVPRMARTLKVLGYNEQTGTAVSCANHSVFLGIVFNMLAIADTEAPKSWLDIERPGWNWFQQGQRLVKYFGPTETGELDHVCYYTLGAVYLLRLELLSHASVYIMQAWNLATVTGMNDQSFWPRASHSKNLARQKLWWALYYIDTHVARRRGRPYLIRDSEVSVAEFIPRLSVMGKYTAQEPKPVDEQPISLGDTGMRDLEYHQTAISFGRIWKQIWDTLFSARLGRFADAQDVEVLDARILYLERITPSSLKLDANQEILQQTQGESETFVRRRLLCQLQFNLFRMIIRQNPLRKTQVSQYDQETCVVLARDNIYMCAAYIAAYSDCLRPAANLLTLHLSETLYHLTYALCDGDADVGLLNITDSFKMAYGLLKKLARSFYGSRKALRAVTTSYLAFKRTVIGSSTLGHLVDFIFKEHEVMVNSSSDGESATIQSQNEATCAPSQSSSVFQIPVAAIMNDDPGIGFDLDHLMAHDKSGLHWPVMNDVDLGTMEGLSWPELELGLEREVSQRMIQTSYDQQQWAMLANRAPGSGTQTSGEVYGNAP
ncbi:hypothetical protein PV08_04170 [Exophiala spinifera]|uniref:Xylanolytic transcriptional activator regulatory domain-containing protein n=1 Tax=Exophiala spinifera TaxID=91928 RepID=A0A0D2C071_9EURO|nr:uncharacterized protein PV08_04170 [Exophiala spinifera]KIW16979.1 hypothetical protein PV08_04170 [Exophiala spinifera]